MNSIKANDNSNEIINLFINHLYTKIYSFYKSSFISSSLSILNSKGFPFISFNILCNENFCFFCVYFFNFN